MSHITENDVKKSCLDYLRMRGHWAVRVNSGAVTGEYNGKQRFVRFTDAPVLDIVGCAQPSGRFFTVECKRPGKRGQVSEIQAATIEQVEAAGGLAIVACSVDDLIKAGL